MKNDNNRQTRSETDWLKTYRKSGLTWTFSGLSDVNIKREDVQSSDKLKKSNSFYNMLTTKTQHQPKHQQTN
uniref:Uncharacterized protein n=1 Tax=Glossina pallidipes TaxID=7398 RepID=A0A1A9Z0C5_GLOPL